MGHLTALHSKSSNASRIIGKHKQNWFHYDLDVMISNALSETTWLKLLILFLIGLMAFSLRLFSVLRFESIIHEFDPWFNFRSTQFVVENGVSEFLNWFDERSWYPLGRAVGGTVYPGIMATSATIHFLLNDILTLNLSIKDICVFLAPVFSSFTCVATYLLTKEMKDSSAGLLSAIFVGFAPGYISRSVAGSYDNEGIAIFLLMITFYFWIRALKRGSVFSAVIASLFYYWMVSSWGGYVFITNLVPLHVLTLMVLGRYSSRLYVSYSTYYIIGTLASMTIPMVGTSPVKTSEHMAALGVFGLVQLVGFVSLVKSHARNSDSFHRFLKLFVLLIFFASLCTLIFLTKKGVVAPWTGRFYSLFDTDYAKVHIPIIASVSEHQPTAWTSFFFDLNYLVYLFPVGIAIAFKARRDEHIFLILYALTASYFAGVMVRLMLTLTPIVCISAAIAMSRLLDVYLIRKNDETDKISLRTKSMVLLPFLYFSTMFIWHSVWVTSNAYSSPSVILSSSDRAGNHYIIDDFREAYYWLRKNTDSTSKVLAWWDYGYQISGMADRTTIVDNNTWNNTHIAMVGKIFASNEENALKDLKALDIDYVLVLFGGVSGFGGDDLNKFLWMVRIAEGEFPNDVKEAAFYNSRGEYKLDDSASETLKESLMYKLSFYGFTDIAGPGAQDRARHTPGPSKNPVFTTFEEAFSTENWIVRIYKVKKDDPLGRSHFEDSAFNRLFP